ncbi:hypothetical protein [uncultured Roseobacter sp.]|uniref:hypothetical protein n=1 Tax=uncultured Roseobacter sp. TaxID=114847 RepID=UPI002622A43D|nr:hypothetical protein [uncultured Roseobacter sp.]
MTARLFLSATLLAAVGACTTPIPLSGPDTGFDNSAQTQQQRDAALNGLQSTLPVGSPLDPASPEATAAETTRILAETRSPAAPDLGQPPIEASPANPAPVTLNNPGISDENDFDAVAERESIESDAARIANNRAQYEVVTPEALPARPSDDQPNIVAFALSTSHPKGQSVYARAGFGGSTRAERNCADYRSADQAQIDFLARGGPTRDRRGIDPDGDGYACGWDPAPYRAASDG